MVSSKRDTNYIPVFADFEAVVEVTPQLSALAASPNLATFFPEYRASWEYLWILFTSLDNAPKKAATVAALRRKVEEFYEIPVTSAPFLAAVIDHGLTMRWTGPLEAEIAIDCTWFPTPENHPNRMSHAKEWIAGREPRFLR